MAIAYDNKTTSTTEPYNHTCGASATLLVVSVFCTATTVSGITYDGVAMSLADSITPTGGHFVVYYLMSPGVSAAKSVDISFAGTPTVLLSSATSYSGTATASVLGTYDKGTAAGGADINKTITTGTANSIVYAACYGVNNSAIETWTWASPLAERFDHGVRVSAYRAAESGGEQATTTAGSYDSAATANANQTVLGIVCAEFKPPAVVAAVKDLIQAGVIPFAR